MPEIYRMMPDDRDSLLKTIENGEPIVFETGERTFKYVQERTCRQVITECNDGLMPPFTANCSECGSAWGYTPSYCPECHAKVIGD